MAIVGIPRLDDLFTGAAGATPITSADSGEVVGVVQQLLRNFELRKVPGTRHVTSTAVPSDPDAEHFGTFGKYTKRAVTYLRKHWGLSPIDPPVVDGPLLRKLMQTAAVTPSVGRGYLTRLLDVPDSVLCRVLALISAFEENAVVGGFRAWKPQDRTDLPKTGLSYGILQWTHGSGRLGDVLDRYASGTLGPLFTSCFGVSGAEQAAMIAHAHAGQAVLNNDGSPSDPALARFDFQKASLWKSKFDIASRKTSFQLQQVNLALDDLRALHTARKAQWSLISTERAWGFMLDLANQRGSGGANSMYTAAQTAFPAGPENVILKHIEDHGLAADQPRRHFFRADSPLSDSTPFPDSP